MSRWYNSPIHKYLVRYIFFKNAILFDNFVKEYLKINYLLYLFLDIIKPFFCFLHFPHFNSIGGNTIIDVI